MVWFLALASCIFVALYWLLQPVKSANRGLAAYTPPPSTRLEPLPRKMDAPELATPQSPLHALAQDYAGHAAADAPPQQPDVRRPAPKRQRTAVRREPQGPSPQAPQAPFWGFQPAWNAGYRDYDRYRQRDYRPWW